MLFRSTGHPSCLEHSPQLQQELDGCSEEMRRGKAYINKKHRGGHVGGICDQQEPFVC